MDWGQEAAKVEAQDAKIKPSTNWIDEAALVESKPTADNATIQNSNQSFFDNYAKGNFSERKKKIAEELKKRGFIPQVVEDITGRTKKLGEFVGRQDSILDAPKVGAVAFGQAVGGVEDIAGELISRGIGAVIPEDVKETIGNTLSELAQTDIGKVGLTALKKGTDAFESFESEFPDAGMAIRSALNIFGGSLATKALGSAQIGKELIDATGRPTRVLTNILNKKGLDFDSLSPSAREALPERIDTGILEDITAKTIAEESLTKQIEAGAKDDSLAGLMVKGGTLVSDDIAKHAVKQGFSKGFVQSIKSSSPKTKENMLKMSSIMRRIKKSERLGLDMRPSDVIGDSVTERIKFIKDKSNEARKELNEIAKTKLAGQSIDGAKVLNTLSEGLDDLDIRIKRKNGVPEPYFKGSLISKDRSSQKVIRDLIDLMSEGGEPDALRFHKLKRQLDTMLDYNKKSAMGLSDAGKKVLKDVRRSLNDSLRDVNPDYARVNDVMSKSLGVLGDLDKSMGTMDIFGDGANKAIGQRMRALLSNQQSRIKMNNALNDIEDISKEFGGKFDDDIKDLVMFADGLDSRFGTTAKTSFAGQTTQGMAEVMKLGKPSVMQVAASVIGKGVGKAKGVTDLTSFDALESLLKRR